MSIIPYLILFILVVIVGLVGGFLKYRRTTASRSQGSNIELKERGRKIRVFFDQCEIKTREYTEVVVPESVPTRLEILDSLYDPNRSHKEMQKTVSVLIYRSQDVNGATIEYRSQPIYLSADTLRYYLANKKETTIYVDSGNPNHYYFDINFLQS